MVFFDKNRNLEKYKKNIFDFTNRLSSSERTNDSLVLKIIRLSNESQQFENEGKIKEARIKAKWAIHFIEEYYDKEENKNLKRIITKYLNSKDFIIYFTIFSCLSLVIIGITISLFPSIKRNFYVLVVTLLIFSIFSLSFLYLRYISIFDIKRTRNLIFQYVGIGTEKNPFIITSLKIPNEEFTIPYSSYFIKILNCSISLLIINKSENILIKSSEIKQSNIYASSNISVNSSKIERLWFYNSSDISINSSEFEDLEFVSSSYILAGDNFIKRTLSLENGHKIVLEKSTITRLSMKGSYEYEIVDCKIKNKNIKNKDE